MEIPRDQRHITFNGLDNKVYYRVGQKNVTLIQFLPVSQ